MPEVKSTVVNVEGFKVPSDVNKVTQLAYFLHETLHLGASALHQLIMQVRVYTMYDCHQKFECTLYIEHYPQ